MRKTIALLVSTAFLLGTTGLAMAQTSTAPAEKKMEEKKMDDKAAKPAAKKLTMEEKKAACLDKAGTDEAKKASCEKKYTAKPKAATKEMSSDKKDTMTGAKKEEKKEEKK